MRDELKKEYIREDSDIAPEGHCRVVIENVSPQIDCGRFPIKRVTGETVSVEADIFSDGHDEISATLLWKGEKEPQWHGVPLRFIGNDRWRAGFTVAEPGRYLYTVRAGIDHFGTWRKDLQKRFDAGRDLAVDRLIGASLIEATTVNAPADEREMLLHQAERIRVSGDDADAVAATANPELERLMNARNAGGMQTSYERVLEVVVERREALFSAWYEMFPRSCVGGEVGHGTLAECECLLPAIAAMGFDVVYFPPIHPIGRTNRKGRNNSPVAEAEDPGSPWAIGSAEGGHKSLHPDLGTMADLDRFIAKAAQAGLRVAMDIAFQCSPDHPYVSGRPEWFRWRPDGTVQYAENPPKRYEDIIPFDFETGEWRSLWRELLDVIEFWIVKGITIFRVDNPHTKPFPFWEWLIREVKERNPEVIFLAEAFTRPKVMYRLAKLGFSQSYTYFSWRNTRFELEQYMTELTATEVKEFFRPNFWPNTPDILPEFLQFGGETAFAIRFLLASTLSASYGIYGPPFELFVDEGLTGMEEYRDSEKYQIRKWDWSRAANMRDLITMVNRIRRENPALQSTWNIRFCESDNANVICFMKRSDDMCLLVCISLDPFNDQSANVRVPVEELGIAPGHPILMQDLLSRERSFWHGERGLVELSIRQIPAKIYLLRPRLRRENDFDYFM